MRKPRYRETKELAPGITFSKRHDLDSNLKPCENKIHALSMMLHTSPHLSGLCFLHFSSTTLTPEVTGYLENELACYCHLQREKHPSWSRDCHFLRQKTAQRVSDSEAVNQGILHSIPWEY